MLVAVIIETISYTVECMKIQEINVTVQAYCPGYMLFYENNNGYPNEAFNILYAVVLHYIIVFSLDHQI